MEWTARVRQTATYIEAIYKKVGRRLNKTIVKKRHICYNILVYAYEEKEGVNNMLLLLVIYMLLFLIFIFIVFAIVQIKLAGMNIKDFYSFIEANQTLDKLYRFSKKYDKLSSQDQLIFLKEAERVFDAFDKVPNMLWEEEYNKYMEVLDKYKDIKMVRWVNDN